MKKSLYMLFIFTIVLSPHGEAQILNKVKERVKQSAENRVVNKAENATEKTMDKMEEGARGKKNDKSGEAPGELTNDQREKAGQANKAGDSNTLIAYSNYDFVPGDRIIYFYDMAGETDSEIPGRMLVDDGIAEIQTYQGEKVLFVPASTQTSMHPDISGHAYLPEQYTVEFDMLGNGGNDHTTNGTYLTLYFREKDAPSGSSGSAISPIKISLDQISGSVPAYALLTYDKNQNSKGTHNQNFASQAVNTKQKNWRRVSIYVNKNIAKLYADQHRIGIQNQVVPGYAAYLDIEITTHDHPVMFKNFRIAAGGADSYNKIITDGKFIAYGIQFDVNKSTLKPESMGTINEFVKMMKEKPELKFEIGGHTDSDGTVAGNQTLSQERADAV